jgi:serine/threonine protein kinase
MPAKTKKKARLCHRQQNAGGIIGKGTYGCVYRPSLKCGSANSPQNNETSKLLSHDEAAKEMSYSKLFNKIDPTQKYFLYATKGCRFDVDIQNDPIKQQLWANIQQYNIKKRKCPAANIMFPQEYRINADVLQMPYGGLQPTQLKIEAADYFGFFKSIGNLLNAIRLLHRAGYIHHDIKIQNMLVQKIGDGKFQTRLIDFGLMNKIATIADRFNNGTPDEMDAHKHYTSAYPIWPIMTFALYENQNIYDLLTDEKKIDLYKVVTKEWTKKSNNYYDNHIPPHICYNFSFDNGQIKPHYIFELADFNHVYQNLLSLGTIENFIKYIDIYSSIIAITYIFSHYFNFRVGLDWDPSNATNPTVLIADFTTDIYVEYTKYNWTADQMGVKMWLEDFIKYVADPFYNFAIGICRMVNFDRPVIIDKLILYFETYFLHNMKLLLYDGDVLRPEFIRYLVIFKEFSMAVPGGDPYTTPTGLNIYHENQFNIFEKIPAIKRNNTKKQARNNNNQSKNRPTKIPALI